MVKVAAVQAAPVWLDAKGTLDKTIALIEEAGKQDVKLIAFGEVWLPGYPYSIWFVPPMAGMDVVMRHRMNAIEVDGPEMKAIGEAAKAAGTHVMTGYAERAHGSIYCGQALIDDRGELIVSRRKLKPTHMERTVWGEGPATDLKVNETSIGRVGGLCCWENLQPINRHGMFSLGEQIHVAAWPSFGMFKNVPQAFALSAEMNMNESRSYALEGSCFVLCPSSIITEDLIDEITLGDERAKQLVQPGGGEAVIFGPDGSRLTDPIDEHEDGLAIADIDLAMIEASKIFIDPAGHYNRPDVARTVLERASSGAEPTPETAVEPASEEA
ncbi:carbon-nitrogen hydrolase family protein [Ruegeria sp. HKCCC1038]|uniref:carbon-nitrogen hydrolase family protein n=1 Tax=Ruegeria sp. HKCCC1038 TaxID=2682982 RepID=UPI0014882AF8|nr:carbon-nitrogen hydrolase family protein [Ruegeria sp. HKCCC1038]